MSTLLENAIKKLNTLDEAFSDTMPDWMRQGFQSYAKHRKGNFNTPFSQARYGSRYQGEQNLFNLLLNAGYDVSKMNVITAPVPSKLDDEIFDNPDVLPVFHIVTPNDNKIWIQGINDQEQFLDENGKESKFSYMNNAKLKKYVKDFAYIDLSAPETHSIEKTTNPEEAKLYSGKPINYRLYRNWANNDIKLQDKILNSRRFVSGKDELTNYYNNKTVDDFFDKSGYYHGDQLISDTLRNKLKDYKNKRIPQRVFQMERELIDLRDDLNSAVQSNLFKNDVRDYSQNRLAYDENKDLLNKYSNLLYKFQEVLKVAEYITNHPDEEVNVWHANSVHDFEADLNQFKDELKPYKKAIFVW